MFCAGCSTCLLVPRSLHLARASVLGTVERVAPVAVAVPTPRCFVRTGHRRFPSTIFRLPTIKPLLFSRCSLPSLHAKLLIPIGTVGRYYAEKSRQQSQEAAAASAPTSSAAGGAAGAASTGAAAARGGGSGKAPARQGGVYNYGMDDENFDYIVHEGEVFQGRYAVRETIGKGESSGRVGTGDWFGKSR